MRVDIGAYFEAEEVVELTRDLIRIPSHVDAPGREAEMARFIHRFCSTRGLDAAIVPVDGERANVMATVRGSGGGRTLLLNGHIDTVPPYDMTIEPYGAELRDGFVWGRGASDMKGAIASMLIAMLALKRSGQVLAGDLVFSGVIGEEERSEGSEYLVKSGFKADGAVVGEPSNYEYALGHRGLEWLDIRFKGKAAHGGMPSLGVNAISKAAKFIRAVEDSLYPLLAERFDERMGPSVMNLGRIEGGTQPSTVADWCSLRIDRRYIPGESVQTVLAEFQGVIDRLKAEDPDFDATIERMPNNMLTLDHVYLSTPAEAPIALAVKAALARRIGREPEMTRRRGWTDAALLSAYAGIPTIVTGPGDIKYSHTADERVPVAQLVDYVSIYGDIAQDFCV